MGKLYCVPLGGTARKRFINEITAKGWEDSLLVLPSGVLQSRALKEGAVRVKNFDDVATGLLNANGYTGLKRISRRTQELIVGEILHQYAEENQLAYFNVLIEKKGFVKAVTSLIGQLSRSGAKMEEIYEALNSWDRQGKPGLKDREIAAVYTAYRQKLKKEDWFDVEGLYRLAVYVLQRENPAVPWHNLYFSEFYHFDGLQVELLRELKRYCNINVGLMYDAKRPEIFAAVQDTFLDLSGFLDVEKLETNQAENTGALEILKAKLGEETNIKYSGGSIKLLEASGREEEIRAVLREVKMLLQQGADSGEIIIMLRDFSFYTGLRNLSDEYGIPVSLPQTAKLNNEPLTELLYAIIKNAAHNAADVNNLWNVLGCQAVKLFFKFDAGKLLRLKMNKYYQSQKVFLDDVKAVLTDEEQQEFLRFEELLHIVPVSSDIETYCSQLFTLLDALAIPQTLGGACKTGTADYNAVKNYLLAKIKIEDILAVLQKDYDAIGMLNKKITALEFADIFGEAVQGVELVLQNGSVNGVLITEAANIQGVGYKYVFLLGVREGEFPALKTENWIYNDYERAAMGSLGIDLPGTVAGLNEDRYFFAAAIAAAQERLTISWYSDDHGGASAYIEMVENTFAENSLQKENCKYVTAENALSVEELAEKLVVSDRCNNWLKETFNGWERRSEAEYRRRECFDSYNGVLQQPELLQKLRARLGSSFNASGLEVYAECPFKYLVNYLWKQSEYAEADESIAFTDEGSLMHAAAAEFISHYINKKISDYELDNLLAEMSAIFEALAVEYENTGKLKDTVFLKYQKENILKQLLKFVQKEYEYSAEWYGYRPLAVEMPFGAGTGLSLKIDDGKGGTINLRGRIDRLDAGADDIFVTDYKRSSMPDNKKLTQGLDLQMPVYLLAAEQLTQDKTVLGGSYYSFGKNIRSSGIIFKNTDKNARPPFLKKALVKNWDEFTAAAGTFITGYVERMRSGDFKPLPAVKCSEYCPARGICRRYNMQNAGGADENV